MEIEEKEIDGVKYVPAKAFYDMWKQLGEEIDDLDEEIKLLKKWEACADRLFVYAMETLSTATNMALYEVAKEDVIDYNRLKNGTQSNE